MKFCQVFCQVSLKLVGYLALYGINEGFSLIAVMREDFNPGDIRIEWGHFNVLSHH
jgi:hypothetical protein